jgi:peptidyl-prolyl cis-trans isomerase SurA
MPLCIRPPALLFFAAAAVAALLSPASVDASLAQSAVRVLVNDEPVTSYDIRNRTQMLRLFSRGQQGEKQAIEQLIDEKLMLQEAKRRNVSVTDEEVQQEMARRAAASRLSPTQFEQALRQSGVDPRTFRDFLRANLAWSEIVRARFRATAQVSELDVAAALPTGEDAPEQKTVSEYMLQQILFVVPAKAAGGVEGKRQREAAAFKSGFQGCDASLQQANGMAGVVVKPTVRREEHQLSAQMKEALAPLDVGGIVGPDRVSEGFQLVAICAKKEIAGQTEAEVEARDKLQDERGQMLARRYLRDLRSDASIEYR